MAGEDRTRAKNPSIRYLKLGKSTGNKVDMVVIQCGAGQHCAVWVEGRAGNWGGTVVVEEARVRLEGGEVGAVNIERLDLVAVRAPKTRVSIKSLNH